MNHFILSISLFSAALFRGAFAYDSPPEIFQASQFTKWTKSFEKSRLAEIEVPFVASDGSADSVFMKRLDIIGDEYTRGKAHGALLAKEIAEFVKVLIILLYVF